MSMKTIDITPEECMAIFKKYDKPVYDYYISNMKYIGSAAEAHAVFLKKKHERK